MYREMVTMGKPYPEYTVYKDAIRLTLYSATDDENFVRFIAETQDKRIKSFSLSELMILRYLYDNKDISLSKASELTQLPISEVKSSLRVLENEDFIELSGRVYMFTSIVYEKLKSGIKYVQDKSVTYLKAKDLILEYLSTHESINNETIRRLCRCTDKQAGYYTRKMTHDNILEQVGKNKGAKYILK